MKNDTLNSLHAEIARLEHRLDALRAKSKALTVHQIVNLMRQLQITPDEITAAYQLLSPQPARAPIERLDGRSRVAPKYLDPETGYTWSGRGIVPRWLAAAELEGRSRQHFVVGQLPPR
ncbi:H-NS histone family protein [Achromobacter piechaudii]|uniref:H-NS histone family protein n=1 Tax=Achromobacter piechaudii TaxID=72556 RepID=UPI001582FEB6